LWISTEYFGDNKGAELFRIDPLETSFSAVHMPDEIWGFREDPDGTKWFCTRNKGLIKIDAKTHDTIYLKHNSKDPFSISNNGIFSIQPDTNGFYWVGTWNGLNHFDSKTNRFTKYLYNAISKGDQVDTMAGTLLKGDKGELYIKSNYGFFIMNPQNGSKEIYQNNAADTASLSVNTIVSSFKEKSGNIWLGTWNNGGLNLFNNKTKTFKHYLTGLTIWNIYRDTRDILWVATNNGLYYRNDNADIFIPVEEFGKEFRTASIGFVSLEDKEGNLWGSSSLGIFRFNPSKHELCVYGKKFFPNSDDWGDGEKTTDGKFLFLKYDNYYTFYPGDVVNRLAPGLILTDLKINGRSVSAGDGAPFTGTLEEAKEIKLKYDQNFFAISFAAIHYSSPENNIDSIMLEGYDDKWIKADSSKVAEYQNLSRGKYLFKIKACSSYGVWAEKEVKIIIEKPWWLTWWAIALYIIGFLLLLWPIIKWRTAVLEKDKKVLEQRVQQRTRELRQEKELVESTLAELKSAQAQLIQSEKMASLGEMTAGIAHEIQNPLNFVNNFSEVNKELLADMNEEIEKGNIEEVRAIAKDITENEEKIIHHGKRADSIVKGMLQHSRTSSSQKELTDINALADEYLRLAYHGLRAKDKSFNAEIKTDFDGSIGEITIVPQDIGRIILNLINNAFYAVTERKKQAGDGYEPTVSVSTKKINDKVEIKVADNGGGIPQKIVDKIFQPFFTTKPTGQGTGLGLSLAYDIIKSHGGEIKVNTKEGEGSEFIIQLPFN